MHRALTLLTVTLSLSIASCASAPKTPSLPPKPLPTWSLTDFTCPDEPEVPPQETTKGRAEGYQAGTLAALRSCKSILKARGADAGRYGLIGKTN